MRWNILCAILLLVSPPAGLSQLFPETGDVRAPRSFDVVHYKLVLAFDEAQKRVSGTAHISFAPLHGSIDSITLNAVRMDIREVLSRDSMTLRTASTDSSLTIHLRQPLAPAETSVVSVSYSCTPELGMYFIRPDSSDMTRRHQIWTQGEETENRHWFPCYDAPDDKATSEIIATVREEYSLLSNGALVNVTHDPDRHTRTFHWKQHKPHSSYLIMLAAGEYAVMQDSAGSIPLFHYVYPEDLLHAPRSFSKTPQIMEFFQHLTGYSYPWEKYSHIIVDQFMWGGMENTSAVTLNELYIYDDRAGLDGSAVDVVAHELAHQWAGDLITCRDWSHLWLNEGFASYFEMLYKQHNLGEDEFQMELYASSEAVRNAEQSLGRKPLVARNGHAVNLYQKGAWVLRMLSRFLGEDRFISALQHYFRTYEFQSIGTADFHSSVEESSGEDLDWFFNQWTYGTGHPELTVTTRWDEAGSILTLSITQTQQRDSLTGLFRFPLDIECVTSSGRNLTKVSIEDEVSRFFIPLDEHPRMVTVDAGTHLLATISFRKTKEELLFQLHEGRTVGTRLDALKGLGEYSADADVFHAVKWTAFNDPFRVLREKATAFLDSMKDTVKPEVFFALARDRVPAVRSAAITALGKFRTDDVADVVERTAETDSSYYVLSTCLRVLGDINRDRGFALACRMVETTSYQDMVRRAALNVMRSMGDKRALPYAMAHIGPFTHPSTRIAALGVLREAGASDEGTRQLMQRLIADPNPSVRSSAARTLGSWGDEFRPLLQERLSVEQDPDVLRTLHHVLE